MRKGNKEVSLKGARRAYLAGEYRSVAAAAKMHALHLPPLRDRLHEDQRRAEAHRHKQLLTMKLEKAIVRYTDIYYDWGHRLKVSYIREFVLSMLCADSPGLIGQR